MIDITIDKQTYHAPGDWHELSCADFIEWNDYAKRNMPKVLADRFFEGKEVELTEDTELACLKWYGQFVQHCTGIDDIDTLPMVSEDGVGVVDLYHHLIQFLLTPAEPYEAEEIEHKGKVYQSSTKVIDIMGNDVPMKDATYGAYEERATVVDAIGKLKEGNLGYLPILTAMTFTNDDKLDDRVAAFKDMTMDKIWPAYFFLTARLNTLATSLARYSKAVAVQAARASQPPTVDGLASSTT